MDNVSIKKTFSKIGLSFFIFIVITQFTALALEILLIKITGDTSIASKGDGLFTYLLSFIPMYAIALPVLIIMLNTSSFKPVIPPSRFRLSPKNYLMILIMCIGGMEAGNIIGNLVTLSFADLIGSDHSSNYITEIITNSSPLYTFIFTALLAPIFEELIFRKFLIDRTYKYGERNAIILSGLMFGLFHTNLGQFFYAFIIGAIFAWVYIRTGNILYSMSMHLLINLLGGTVPILLLSHVDISSISEMSTQELFTYVEGLDTASLCWCMAYSLLMIFMFAAAIAGVILFIRNRSKMVVDVNPPIITKNNKSLVYGNAGMILFIVVTVLLAVYVLFFA